jgi:O-antigen ligase
LGARAKGVSPKDISPSKGQGWLRGVWIAAAILTPLVAWLGARGFAPELALLGLATIVWLRPRGWDLVAFALLAAVAAWSLVSCSWSTAANLKVHSSKDFERLTYLHMGLQLVLSGAFVMSARRLAPTTAHTALRWMGWGLVGLAAMLLIEGATQAKLYQAMQGIITPTVRPDLAVRNVALGGYVLAALIWPVSAALWVKKQHIAALFLALAVLISTFVLRGDSPTVASVFGAVVFCLVYRFGRPAVLAVMAVAVGYWLLTPWGLMGLDHLGLLDRINGHLPASWNRRLEIWSFAVDRWQENPILGLGLDASRNYPSYIQLHPHDGAVQVWLELGALGAVLTAGFWGLMLWRVAERAHERLWAATASATATVYLVIGAISFGLWQEWWICLGALALAACLALGRFIGLDRSQWDPPKTARKPFRFKPAFKPRSLQTRPPKPLSPATGQVLLIIAVGLAARLITAAVMGLGMDESYSTAVSRDLHLSYFDHPPLHQWIAHLAGTALGYGRWVRLPFIFLFAGSTWLMHRVTARLFGESAGVWAALALNLSLFFTLAAGSWVLPDGPLVFCLLAAALSLTRLLFPRDGERDQQWLWWPMTGLWMGLAALSKYQAAPVALGLALFLLTTADGRHRLRHPAAWLGGLLALAVASPVLIWNGQHEWVSFAFQAGRGAPRHLSPTGPLASLAGQLALLAPWVAIPLIWAGVGAAKSGPRDPRSWLCLTAAAPTVLLFTLLPILGTKGLPHWPMPGWLFVFPLLGERLARSTRTGRQWPARWAIASGAALVLIWAAAASDAATGWIKTRIPALKTSPTAEAIDWRALRTELDKRGLLKPGMFVVAAEWNEAGKIDQALGDRVRVLVFNKDPREYAFRSDKGLIGHDALIIGRDETVAQEMAAMAPHFASLSPLYGVSVGRGGQDEIPLTIILAKGLKTPYPRPPWAK